jgi:outer membrane protein OmpA-like peptidoglycan-associated protein
VRLDGHTDWFGTDEYNMVLSENRALSAYKYLIDKGISQDRIVNRWFGESMPAVPNANPDGSDNPENRQLNRRVEIKVDIPEMASIYIQL